MRDIELLAPAANAEVAIEAIKHGADAVYIGPPSHGARKGASNRIEDISKVVDFAHLFGAKVYATVNTIVYENELKDVERLTWKLYHAGVDALIVQDMSLLRLKLPPIALHASTQCDTRTADKARFLQEAGFSQIVLARELTLNEINEIYNAVSVPIEVFVHGALCVSYSGRCHASLVMTGRSANRGECSQICRLPFTLKDSSGKIIAHNRHLLSLKDYNLSDRLEELLNAGVSSFKIEGRLKDINYVKNVVSYYRMKLDEIIETNTDKYRRSSYGKTEFSFTPQLDKSFNRGFTHYFIDSRRPKSLTSPLTPKSMGEKITDIHMLHNGDGISYFNQRNEYEGVIVNGIKDGRIISNRPFRLPKGAEIRRTFDIEWQKIMQRSSAERRLWINITLDKKSLKGFDERGVSAIVPLNAELQKALKPHDLRDAIDKFGNTRYWLKDFKSEIEGDIFIPPSRIADARRRLLNAMAIASKATYQFDKRIEENKDFPYPAKVMDYQDNVANSMAKEFFYSHGVVSISMAMETEKRTDRKETPRSVMTTRHCILRELGICLRYDKRGSGLKLPLTITNGNKSFTLDFDCRRCEMHLLST